MSNTNRDHLDYKILLYLPNSADVESDLDGMDLMAKSNGNEQVKRSILLLVLMATHSHAITATELEGSEYTNWCRQHAFGDKIPSEEQDEYVTACIKRLVDADKRPKKTPDDETERQTGEN